MSAGRGLGRSIAASAAKSEEAGGTTSHSIPLETAGGRAHVTCRMSSLRSRLALRRFPLQAARVVLASAGLLISGTIMAQECPLSAPLTVKDTQGGFAGETGTVWTIAPDCNFTVARQIGLKILDPHKQGRLTSEQQARLRELLDRMAVVALPERLGGEPQVNARQIALSYAGKQSVLNLPPGGGDLNALRRATGDDPAGRMLELVDILRGMTGS